MNILITGGYGCIASETKKVLLNRSSVGKIILLSRSARKVSSLESDKVVGLQADLYDTEQIKSIIEEQEIDVILHTAAIRTAEAQENPQEAFKVNVTATTSLLEAARLSKRIKRFVFISTAAVYGDINFEANETTPTSSSLTYIATKLAAEQVCECYAKSYHIPTVVLRPQILYGPSRLSEGSTGTLSYAIIEAAKGNDYTIDFKGPHSFHFTEDIGELLTLTMLNDHKSPFEIYNLPGYSYACSEIAKSLVEITKGQCKIDVSEKTLPFPSKINSDKFNHDYPGYQCHDLKASIERSFEIVRNNN